MSKPRELESEFGAMRMYTGVRRCSCAAPFRTCSVFGEMQPAVEGLR